jgi:transcriptional regulator with XRE-family HTH domain
MSHRPWTESELAILRSSYRHIPTRDIAIQLGRSPAAVQQRARLQGLAGPAPRRWTTADVDRLRRLAPGRSLADLVRVFGRSPDCVAEKLRALGIVGRPVWTDAEEARLRELHLMVPRPSYAAMGRLLGGRSADAVIQKARAMRLARKHFVCRTSHLRRLRELHGLGRSDAEIAAEIGTNRRTVGKYRRGMLGLSSNAGSAHRRGRIAAATRDQLDRDNFAGLVELKNLAFRLEAVRAGWPPEVSRGGRRVLDLLDDRGPLGGAEVRAALGMKHVPQSTFRALERLGVVAVARRPARSGGNLYTLAVERRRPRRAI